MKLTKRGEYALRTLIHLGIEERRGVETVSVSSLAESEKLPCKFLENILDRYTLEHVVEVTMCKEERDRTARPRTKASKKAKRHADPADGFVAALLEIKPTS